MKYHRTEQNPHPVDTAISPDRVQLVLFIEPPDRFDFLADLGGAEFLDSLTDVLVPEGNLGLRYWDSVCWKTIGLPSGNHNDIGFDFASVIEKRASFVESLKFRTALDLDLTIDDHRAGADV